jgi:acetyltransferase-like isoleucine patch superfamily enzyme
MNNNLPWLQRVQIRLEYYCDVTRLRITNSVIYQYIMQNVPLLKSFYETQDNQTPITFSLWFIQKVLGFNRSAYWPMHFTSQVGNVRNVYAGIDTSPGYMPGCYIQSEGKIYIGDHTQIACNVGIITANHSLYDTRIHSEPEEVSIGSYCWIGMNSVILPGVILGDFTVVGAGSIVTKSFPKGYCVIAGNPARKIKDLPAEKCLRYRNKIEYNGYILHEKFDQFRRKNLNL